jgi:outer membrane protein W
MLKSYIKKIFLFFFIIPSYLFCFQSYVEIKPGYFIFNESTLNKIFKHGGLTAQAEGGVIFCKNYAASLNFQYFSRSATAINSTRNTTVYIPTLSLFIKGFRPFKSYLKPYIGIGPRIFFFKNTNHSPYVPHRNFKSNLGFAVTIGTFFYVNKNQIFIDPFLDYGYAKSSKGKKGNSSKQYDANLGGLTIGLGLGYKF